MDAQFLDKRIKDQKEYIGELVAKKQCMTLYRLQEIVLSAEGQLAYFERKKRELDMMSTQPTFSGVKFIYHEPKTCDCKLAAMYTAKSMCHGHCLF